MTLLIKGYKKARVYYILRYKVFVKLERSRRETQGVKKIRRGLQFTVILDFLKCSLVRLALVFVCEDCEGMGVGSRLSRSEDQETKSK